MLWPGLQEEASFNNLAGQQIRSGWVKELLTFGVSVPGPHVNVRRVPFVV
jgi:hypothetical protein